MFVCMYDFVCVFVYIDESVQGIPPGRVLR